MPEQPATNLPGQPDGIEDDSRDLPDPHRAADRVGDYIRATGDGLYDTVNGAPLYGRDLEALTRATEQLADAHAAAARSATDATNLREQLDRANTGRQQLAEELAEVRDAAHRQKQALDAERAQWQAEIANLRNLISKYGEDGNIPVTAISTALREGPPVRPGSSRRAQADALRWAADRIDPGPAATRRKATDVHDLGVLNANRGTASNLRLWASSVERGVINVSESDQAGPSAPPRVTLPIYGDDAPGTLRSRP